MVTKKAIQKILSECSFDPKKNSSFSFVLRMGNSAYTEMKATECIEEARQALMSGVYQTYVDKINQSITLLAIARIQRDNEQREPPVSNEIF